MRWPRWRIGLKGLRAPECTLLGTRQQLVFQPDDVHERGDGLEVRNLDPAMPDAPRHRPVRHGLLDDAWQAVRRADLVLLGIGQDERAADAGFHRVQVAELAPADLVHPHPLPGRAEVDDLLRNVSQRAQLLAGLLESLAGARRQVLHRLVGLGPLPRAQIKVCGPITCGLFGHRAPKLQARSRAIPESITRNRPGASRSETAPDRASARTTVVAPPSARPFPSRA